MAVSWEQAQKHEKSFWESIYVRREKDIETYLPLTPEMALDFSAKTLVRFGHTFDLLRGKSILDVGCGPHGVTTGIILQTHGDPARVPVTIYAIDTLMGSYKSFGTLPSDERVKLITAKGESMPLAENSIDYIYCVNVLDHVDRPERFIESCHRTCKRDGGQLLCAVHVVRRPFAWLRPFLFLVDKNHPHHFTKRKVLQMVWQHFDHVDTCAEVPISEDQPDFTFSSVLRSGNSRLRTLKRWASTMLLYTLYLRCQK